MITPYESDVTKLREVFSGFPSGVAALAAEIDGEPLVLVASSFTVGVSQDPPLVLFAVQHTSTTWPTLRAAPTIGVSVLGERHAEKTRQLASKERDHRFAGVPTTRTDAGSIFLDDAPVWLDCSVEHCYPAGDHDIIVLRVRGLHMDHQHQPLIWHRSAFARLSA